MATQRVNPYRLGSNYNLLFGHLMTLGIRTITFNELLDFAVNELGMKRGSNNNSGANASVGVILSPRVESAEGFEVKECRGNWSSNGHLYYMERLKRRTIKNDDDKDVLEPANDIRMRLKWREPPLPKLTGRKGNAQAKEAIKAAAQAEIENKRHHINDAFNTCIREQDARVDYYGERWGRHYGMWNHISHGGEQLNPLTIKILCDLERGTFNKINYSKFEDVDKEIQTLERLNYIQKGRFALNGNGKRMLEAICLHASNRFNAAPTEESYIKYGFILKK
jgi:hypothetical protein